MSGTMNSDNEKYTGAPGATTAPGAQPSAADAAAERAAQPSSGTASGAATGTIEALEVELAAVTAERDDFKDRYLRAYADADNIRKRAEREKSDTAKYAIANFARDILNVSDNLRRAMSAVSSAGEERSAALNALIEGVQLTEQDLRNTLERNGIKPIAAEGVQFDPNFHQAVMEREDKTVAAGTVLQVFQEGFRIEDRVLRPAMVVVARGGFKPVKAPAEPATAEAASGAGEPGQSSSTGSTGSAGETSAPEQAKPDEIPGAA